MEDRVQGRIPAGRRADSGANIGHFGAGHIAPPQQVIQFSEGNLQLAGHLIHRLVAPFQE